MELPGLRKRIRKKEERERERKKKEKKEWKEKSIITVSKREEDMAGEKRIAKEKIRAAGTDKKNTNSAEKNQKRQRGRMAVRGGFVPLPFTHTWRI